MSEKFFAVYARTSTSMQQNGLESQVRALKEYCDKGGIKNYKLYIESGVSGAKVNRPVLDQLMMDCEAGIVSAVFVYSFSRFARSSKHLILALETFEKLGIRFVSLTESVDTSSPFGKLIFQVIAGISELERSILIERVKNGIANARSKGRQIGGKPMFTDLSIFRELRAKGVSVKDIARIMKTSESTVRRAFKKLSQEDDSLKAVRDKCS